MCAASPRATLTTTGFHWRSWPTIWANGSWMTHVRRFQCSRKCGSDSGGSRREAFMIAAIYARMLTGRRLLLALLFLLAAATSAPAKGTWVLWSQLYAPSAGDWVRQTT